MAGVGNGTSRCDFSHRDGSARVAGCIADGPDVLNGDLLEDLESIQTLTCNSLTMFIAA